MSSQEPSMGDIFKQRRAAAAKASSSAVSSAIAGSASDRTNSLLQIQREQQQQQQQPRNKGRRNQNNINLSTERASETNNERTHNKGERTSQRGSAKNSRSYNSNHNNNNSNLPKEQGVIHTLLDKFGFILCADRPIELFFHYSEYREGHSDELQVGDEVEFLVGRARGFGGSTDTGGDEEKLAAFDVKKIPRGTIHWESEEEPVGKRWKGLVESPVRDGSSGVGGGGRNGKGDRQGRINFQEGLIRIVNGENDDGGTGEKTGVGSGSGSSSGDKEDDTNKNPWNGVSIYYTPSDYTPVKQSQSLKSQHQPAQSQRLAKSDLVEFTLVTERRTGKQYARNITILRSEKERIRQEKEEKLLELATFEQGKVVSIKGDFGFLKSANRMEEVYFHIANVVAAEAGADESVQGCGGTVEQRPQSINRMPMEGQDVEFYVVDEGAVGGTGSANRNNKKGPKFSARKIKLLPKGTVQFERTLAEGVTGVVMTCPEPKVDHPFGRGSGEKKTEAVSFGTIHLDDPISDDDTGAQVTEVLLHPDNYPGGSFGINRDGSQLGVWIRPGDIVLFDVIRQISDGTCHAIPTKFTKPASDSDDTNAAEESVKPSVRLVEASLFGRAEGVVRSIRDNYGFIHCAERNVDAYFPLYEVFPSDIHGDLVRNSKCVKYEKDPIQKGGRIHVEVGMDVSFDLSLQMLTNVAGGGGGGGGRQKQSRTGEKESLKARRLQILPKSTVVAKITIATGVKATVTKDDPKQPFVGTIELENTLKVHTSELRHPLTVKLLKAFSEGKYGDQVVFHDVISEKDLQPIISMISATNDLDWKYVADTGGDIDDSHDRKLCIMRRRSVEVDAEEVVDEAFESSSGDDVNEKTGDLDANEGGDASIDVIPSGDADKESSDKPKIRKRKRTRNEKVVKSLRFDKFSFSDMSAGPPLVGDVVTCDIVLVRRSGSLVAENIQYVDRKSPPQESDSVGEDNAEIVQSKEVNGFVTEVVPNKQFGFITAVDENGSKTGEHVFFQFRSIQVDGNRQDASAPPSRNKKTPNTEMIRKGDEVKCDVAPDKNGKVTATNVRILPRGTLKLPSKASPLACTGYILLEPSHTSLENTPSHIVMSSSPVSKGGGRWDSCGKEDKTPHKSGSNVKEEGVILLLTDPAHSFSQKSVKSEDYMSPSESDHNSADNNCRERSESNVGVESLVGTHLKYKNGAMAFQGHAAGAIANRPEGPRRGDLVTFSKGKGGKLVKDLRIEKLGAATSVRGRLLELNLSENTAVFVCSGNEGKYSIDLSEVVSCDKSLLQKNEQVDGILHDGKIFGVCRTKDLFLSSSFGRNSSGSSGGLKERPKLNLTVKREMGGKIMAQSLMAKGPDGTNGFAPGWTKRLTAFAKEFVPTFDTVPASATTKEQFVEGE
mmetsp:Transcript_7786/g.16144  ORF Transcript_7786/g.16144 Transcript_7786/m.16144 type:complete len:1398 (+) Transcript_7786:450-4643(+)